MTCSRGHDKSRLDSVLTCLDCMADDAREYESLRAIAKRLVEALALVGPAAKSLMGEMGRGPAVDWCLVNDALVEVAKALADARAAGLVKE